MHQRSSSLTRKTPAPGVPQHHSRRLSAASGTDSRSRARNSSPAARAAQGAEGEGEEVAEAGSMGATKSGTQMPRGFPWEKRGHLFFRSVGLKVGWFKMKK